MTALLEEIEEFLAREDMFSLYEFSWFLRGLDLGLPEPEIAAICQQAYDVIRTRHDLELVWLPWPIDLDAARPVPPGTALDFDIDSTGSAPVPLQALVRRVSEARRYVTPPPADRGELAAALEAGDPEVVVNVLIGVVHADPDRAWLEATCLALIDHPSAEVRGVAVICLGHVARLFGEIDHPRVVPVLTRLLDDETLAGRAEDALDDITTFA